ncbi:pseudouridine-5'-phosphate glycosidase [Streptomyces sp. M2CJ-2]|nr:pseudouridine-5'-phosphate glycosidase [Streptomyces sp. M2CJ-2]
MPRTAPTAVTGADPALLAVDEEVAEALHEGRPVVALESSAIPHGLPYPANLELARDIDMAVRGSGAVPARVGILNGRIVVGMNKEHLERFASDPGIPKVSTRDLGIALAGEFAVQLSLELTEREETGQ